jgi:hypothetical protein
MIKKLILVLFLITASVSYAGTLALQDEKALVGYNSFNKFSVGDYIYWPNGLHGKRTSYTPHPVTSYRYAVYTPKSARIIEVINPSTIRFEITGGYAYLFQTPLLPNNANNYFDDPRLYIEGKQISFISSSLIDEDGGVHFTMTLSNYTGSSNIIENGTIQYSTTAYYDAKKTKIIKQPIKLNWAGKPVNAQGNTIIPYIDGAYSIYIRDSNGNNVSTYNNIVGNSADVPNYIIQDWESASIPLTVASYNTFVNTNTTNQEILTSTDTTANITLFVSRVSLGTKIKKTKSGITTYGIITSINYNNGSSITINVFLGTLYTPSIGAISSMYYSASNTPVGFSSNKDHWSVVFKATNDMTIISPTESKVVVFPTHNISLPIGSWIGYYNYTAEVLSTGNLVNNYIQFSSVTNNLVTADIDIINSMSNTPIGVFESSITRKISINNTINKKYYFVFYGNNFTTSKGGCSYIKLKSTEPYIKKTTVKVRCAYL